MEIRKEFLRRFENVAPLVHIISHYTSCIHVNFCGLLFIRHDRQVIESTQLLVSFGWLPGFAATDTLPFSYQYEADVDKDTQFELPF